jgi:hypothetical protein
VAEVSHQFVLEGDRQIPVQTPRLGANFVPQSRDLAIPRERKPVEDFRRYVLAKVILSLSKDDFERVFRCQSRKSRPSTSSG